MQYVEMAGPEVAAVRIMSKMKTLRAYLKASMALHNRPTESLYQIAQTWGDEVDLLEQVYIGDPTVARYATKFREFVIQHGLDESRPID